MPRPPSACPYGAHSNLCVNQIRRNGTEAQRQKIFTKIDFRRPRRGTGHVRTECRLRRRFDEAQGRQEGRPLRFERFQDVDHQRRRCRHPGGLRQDRPECRRQGHDRLHRRKGHERLHPRHPPRQAGHAQY